MRHFTAFILVEFVMAVVILGVLSISSATILLELKKKEKTAKILAQRHMYLESTLLQIQRLLERAKNISFSDSKLYFEDNGMHVISLDADVLSLDRGGLIDGISKFSAYRIQEDWIVELCQGKGCLNAAVLVYGD